MTAAVLMLLAAAPAADPPATAVEAVHFAPGGPVRVRVAVRIGGRPTEAVWAEAVDALFRLADRNGDGVLDEAERKPFAAGRDQPEEIGGPVRPLRLTFGRGDERVTPEAFRTAVKAAGRGPVTAAATAGRADSDRLTDALFRLLDADRDGTLSAAELAAARDRLAGLDADDDECISDAELLGRPPARSAGPVVPQVADEEADAPADYLFQSGPPAADVKRLLAARGGDRATTLNRTEFGADPALFAALDQDKNGKLDPDELAAWLAHPCDGTVSLDLAESPPGGPVFDRPGLSVRLDPPAGVAAARRTSVPLLPLPPKDGGLDRKALDGRPGELLLFDLADRNGDGKLDAAEHDAATKAFAALAACRAEVTFADAGRGLFELLDRNGDGRLSPRELARAKDLGPVARAG
ncbi:MAG: EF-hand domain-containing protein, partial [Gemmataceae bacterium]|nr:EF-hand domain-containing protein [Gemmataceae bacterium]